MGQKVNPIGLRLGINRTWDSRWYAKGNAYTKLLGEDLKIKSFLKEKLKTSAVSRITVERPAKVARVTIYSAKSIESKFSNCFFNDPTLSISPNMSIILKHELSK